MIEPHELDTMLGGAWHPDLHPFCLRCGYDLTGSVSDRCPECGGAFSRRQIEREAYAIKSRIRQLEFVPDVVSAAFRLAAVGALVTIPIIVFNAKFGIVLPILCRNLARLCGGLSFLLVLSSLQVLRLPPWARARMKQPVDFSRVAITILLAITQFAASILIP